MTCQKTSHSSYQSMLEDEFQNDWFILKKKQSNHGGKKASSESLETCAVNQRSSS